MSEGAADPPPTRWQQAEDRPGYGDTFAHLIAAGEDVEGEARLADAVACRGARVLDVGAGMGRVGAALAARGHRVVAVEPDPALVDQSRRTYPDLPVLAEDVLSVDGPRLRAAGHPEEYDLVVAVGNVLVYLAEDTERLVLARIRALLAPGGRVLAGFHLQGTAAGSREYPPDQFRADCAAAGLRVDLQAGSYELHPPGEEYAVWLLSAAD